MKVFGISLEFNKQKAIEAIVTAINNNMNGYVCVVDGNVLATAFKNESYRGIINDAIVNCCDGSSIALLAGWVHKLKLQAFTGPELFAAFAASGCRQYFLGNTHEVLDSLSKKLANEGIDVAKMKFETLPLRNVEDFDYPEIANGINRFEADIVWVSLGAPKQEQFNSLLVLGIKKGVLIGIGAAFNLYIDAPTGKRAPLWMRKANLEWLYRVVQEPDRIGRRAWNYFRIIPALIIQERKYIRKTRVS